MRTAIIELASYGVFAFALVLFAVQVVAAEIGLRLGLRGARSAQAPREGVSVIVGGGVGVDRLAHGLVGLAIPCARPGSSPLPQRLTALSQQCELKALQPLRLHFTDENVLVVRH